MTLLFRYQNKIVEKSFKIAFSVFITITVISTLKVRDSRKHTPFNFFVIAISINIFGAKVKIHEDNSMHKLRIYSKSEWLELDLIGLETEPKMILNCCRDCTDAK